MADIPSTYPEYPTELQRQEILRHIHAAGGPEPLPSYTAAPAPNRDNCEIVISEFTLSARRRITREYVRCAICSPTTQKFATGLLIWSPDDGLLRAIGHQCGQTHFGSRRYHEMQSTYRRVIAERVATDRLLDTLPTLPSKIVELRGLQSACKDADRIRRKMESEVPAFFQLIKIASIKHEGQLLVERRIENYGTQRPANDQPQEEVSENADFTIVLERVGTIAGIQYVRSAADHDRKCRDIIAQLERIQGGATNDDEVLERVLSLATDGGLLDLDKALRSALRNSDRLTDRLNDFQRFFSKPNAITLNSWLDSSANNTQCRGRIDGALWYLTDRRDGWSWFRLFDGTDFLKGTNLLAG